MSEVHAVVAENGAGKSTLNVARQQLVEIAKALSMNARIIIMDEPTSSLSALALQFSSQHKDLATTLFSTARTASLERNLQWDYQ